jgi:flagellar protein FlaG
MVNPIGGIGAGGAGVAAMRAHAPSAPINPNPSENAPAQADQAPRVMAHKPIAIQFNPAKERQDLTQAVNMLNDLSKETNRGLGFRIDNVINSPVVTVTSAQTGEVVRQIPNEAVIRVAHNIEKVKGMFFNGKA